MRSILIVAASLVLGTAASAKLNPRGGNPASKNALLLDGLQAGLLTVSAASGDGATLRFGSGISRGLVNLVAKAAKGKVAVKKAAIVGLDFDYKEVSRSTFTNAVISEVGLPALDARSKYPAQISLKLVGPATKSVGPGDGGHGLVVDSHVSKKWLQSNFRVFIDGLTEGPRFVSRVEAISIRDGRPSNVILTVAESKLAEFNQWKQKPGSKAGRIEYLTPDLHDTLCTVSLGGLRLISITPEQTAAAGAKTKTKTNGRARIELKPGSVTIACPKLWL